MKGMKGHVSFLTVATVKRLPQVTDITEFMRLKLQHTLAKTLKVPVN